MSWREAYYGRLKKYLQTPRWGSATDLRAALVRIEALEDIVDILIRWNKELSHMSRRYNREMEKEKEEGAKQRDPL